MPKSARPTRNDVAKLSGVSTAVVSYVLNDGPRPVAPATRSRVLEAMKELNYRPNAAARALTLQRTNVLGLLVPDISNPFFAEFGQVVQEAAFSRGYALLLGDTRSDPARERAQIQSIIERQVDGLIIFGVQDLELVEVIIDEQVSLVSMDWQLNEKPIPTVMVDDYRASREAVAHLLAHGHRDVDFIGGPQDLLVSRDRYRGWRDELIEHAPDADIDRLAYNSPYTREGGASIAERIISSESRPTSLFVASDVQAVGVLHALCEADVKVPEDLAIVSFDGTRESEFSNPPLTSVKLPMQQMADLAIEKVLGEEAALVQTHSIVEHSLLLRRSCGCHPE